VSAAAVIAALAGWTVAATLALAVLRLRHRLELVAEAAHELRGAATAIALAAAALRREPGGVRRTLALEPAVERMRGGLADLDAGRAGSSAELRPADVPLAPLLRGIAAGWRPAPDLADRRMRLSWDGRPAVVRADRRRLAQAFSNLVANAVEHGSGEVELRGRSERDTVVVEVRDGGPADRPGPTAPGRGRGLAIAGRAVEEAGGRLRIDRGPRGTVAAIELPLHRDGQGG
jgi:signal transduction histidine kinase